MEIFQNNIFSNKRIPLQAHASGPKNVKIIITHKTWDV